MLSKKAISQLNIDDDKLSRVQSNIVTALDPVLATPILDGNLVQNLTIPVGGKLLVPHQLGRPAVGAFVVMADAPVSVPYAVSGEQFATSGGIVLTFDTGAGAMVSLWVF